MIISRLGRARDPLSGIYNIIFFSYAIVVITYYINLFSNLILPWLRYRTNQISQINKQTIYTQHNNKIQSTFQIDRTTYRTLLVSTFKSFYFNHKL